MVLNLALRSNKTVQRQVLCLRPQHAQQSPVEPLYLTISLWKSLVWDPLIPLISSYTLLTSHRVCC